MAELEKNYNASVIFFLEIMTSEFTTLAKIGILLA